MAAEFIFEDQLISMKHAVIYCAVLFLFFSCQNRKKNEPQKSADTVSITPSYNTAIINDSAALTLSKEILTAIKEKDYQKFASFIDPVDGVRFSPYGYIDTANDRKFSASDFLDFITTKKTEKLNWGDYSGSGEDILLTTDEYFRKFVYDVDFLNAPQMTLNKTLSKGNSLNNIDSVYKDDVYTEFYFPGFDKKYEGMDWRSLKLVFKRGIDKLYFVAIIHDEWTI